VIAWGSERADEDRDQDFVDSCPAPVAKKGDGFLGDAELLGERLVSFHAQIFAGLVERNVNDGDKLILGKHSTPISYENITYPYIITDR
jgi:hypothetical protein